MTQDDKGGGGWVQNGPKNDDVIYEQPLTRRSLIPFLMLTLKLVMRDPVENPVAAKKQ